MWKFVVLSIYFFSSTEIRAFPVCHSQPLKSVWHAAWLRLFGRYGTAMDLADLFMAVAWVINRVEWGFGETGKLFRIDGSGPGWRKQKLRRNHIWLIEIPCYGLGDYDASDKFLLLLKHLLAFLHREKEQRMASYHCFIDTAFDLPYEEGNFRKPLCGTCTSATAQG